jgi:hypothetical protein
VKHWAIVLSYQVVTRCTGIQNWKSINSLRAAVDIECPLIITLVAINQQCMGEDRYWIEGLIGTYRGFRVNSAPNFTTRLKSAQWWMLY